jgi:hypothetical protein
MKKETLKSYLEKSGMSGLTDSNRKMENRMVGMNRAHGRILGRKPNPRDVKEFVDELENKHRTVVTSENREEFMKNKLGLSDKQEPVYDKEDSDEPKFGVKYHNKKGEEEAVKHFDDEEKAKAYMEKGNSIDKVGGKYSLHPIAPVPDKKYIKGTPEHKEAKAKQKPINGHPTNRKK